MDEAEGIVDKKPDETPVLEEKISSPKTQIQFNYRQDSPDVLHDQEVNVESSPEPSIPHETARGRVRPELCRTVSRGRPRRLFQSVRSSENSDLNTQDPKAELDDNVFCGSAEISIDDALRSADKPEWEAAIKSEIESLLQYNTWSTVVKPKNKNIVGSRSVLTNKYSADGCIEKRKARILAKGYSQAFGVDYSHTFALVARLETIRILFAISVELEMVINQLDIKTAYLNGTLEEEVYMEIPQDLPRFLEKIERDEKVEEVVKERAKQMKDSLKDGANACKLNKAVYGLRQVGRQWYTKLSMVLRDLGLESTVNEPCLYYAYQGDKISILDIYVDDILIASQDLTWINEIKGKLAQVFEEKNLGLTGYCLELEIYRDEGSITVSQKGYTTDVLIRFGMNMCNSIDTPAEVQQKKAEDCDFDLRNCPCRKLIGSILYLSVCTRPNIDNTVSRLAQFINAPKESYWKAGKKGSSILSWVHESWIEVYREK